MEVVKLNFKNKFFIILTTFVLSSVLSVALALKNDYTDSVYYPLFTQEEPDMSKRIDGIWLEAPKIKLKEHKTGEKPTKSTIVSALYDDEFLYVAFECEEPNVHNLKTDARERDQKVWNDDCVEIFLSTSHNGIPFAHLIVSAAGVIYDAWDKNPNWNPDYEVVTWKGTENWWTKLKIPFRVFNNSPQETPIWKINFCREEKELGELTSWQKALYGFNNPLSFGDLSFIAQEEYAVYHEKRIGPALNNRGYLLWHESPWKTSYVDSLPVDLSTDIKSLSIKVCQNQKTSTRLMLTNMGGASLSFRLEPFEIRGTSGNYPFNSIFTFKEIIPRLNSYKQRQLDPLTRLNEGNIIVLPALETRAVWIDIKGNLPPGNYQSDIAFIPVDNSKELKKVTVNVEIVDFEFPDVLPVDTYLWGPYSKTWADGKDEAYCGVASEYHLKYLYLGFPKSAIEQGANGPVIRKEQQYYLTDKMRAASKNGKLIYGYGLFSEFDERLRARGFRGEVFDENWIQLFEEWISTWFAHLTDFGLSFDDYIIQLHDEPFPHEIEDLHRCALLLKQIAPDVKIMIDPQSRVSVEDIKILGSVIDLWVPHESLIRTSSESAEYLNFLLETGKPFAPYLCATSNDVQPLLDYYRFRGIRSWLLGASGMFMWAFNSWRGNSWDHWDSEQGSTSRDEAIFYHGDHGPIPSVRAETFREGIEDYYLLSVATEKLKRGDLPREAEALIDPEKLRELMKKNDADEVQKWRDELISYL